MKRWRNWGLLVCCLALTVRGQTPDGSGDDELLAMLAEKQQSAWLRAGKLVVLHEQYRAAELTDSGELEQRIQAAQQAYLRNPDKPERTAQLQRLRYNAIAFNVRYHLANEHHTISEVSQTFDGERFRWEVNILERADSLQPPARTPMADHFDLASNRRRVFSWDGQSYATYFSSGGHAVLDEADFLPRALGGPLMAGLIPWGYGRYSYNMMTAALVSIDEVATEDGLVVRLMFIHENGSEETIDLAPHHDFAPLRRVVVDHEGVTETTTYSDYVSLDGQWLPGSIRSQRHAAADSEKKGRLLGYDYWTVQQADIDAAPREEFQAVFAPATLVEHHVAGLPHSLLYHQTPATTSTGTPLAELRTEALAYQADTDTAPRNCATASLRLAAGNLGIDAAYEDLAPAVDPQTGLTSLTELRAQAEKLGLFAQAAEAAPSALAETANRQVILYLPADNHFALLVHYDPQAAYVADLTNRHFLQRVEREHFERLWSGGVALFVSDTPMELPAGAAPLSESRARDISAGDDCVHGCYECTELLQEYSIGYCTQIGYDCLGVYTIYHERWGPAQSDSGYTVGTGMMRSSYSLCIEDPKNFATCTITGEWTSTYMRACN